MEEMRQLCNNKKCCKYCGKPFAALNICIISRMAQKRRNDEYKTLFFCVLEGEKKSFFPKKEYLGLEPVNPGQSLFVLNFPNAFPSKSRTRSIQCSSSEYYFFSFMQA